MTELAAWLPRVVRCVLVTGTRDWPDPATVVDALDVVSFTNPFPLLLRHGGRGVVDLTAHTWAIDHGWSTAVHVADWRRYGRAAGPIRNAAMVAAGADVCFAFIAGASRGATGCAAAAMAAGIPTWTFRRD